MNRIAGKPREVSIRLNQTIFSQLRQVRSFLGSFGTTSINLEMKLNGQNVVASGMKAVAGDVKNIGDAADKTNNKISLVVKNLQGIAGGAKVTTGLLPGQLGANNDPFADLTASWTRFQGQFAKGVSTAGIISQVRNLETEMMRAGIDTSNFTRKIAELETVLHQTSANNHRKIDFQVSVNKAGAAQIDHLKVEVDGANAALSRTQERIAAIKAAGFGSAEAFDRFKAAVDQSERRATTLKNTMASTRAQIESMVDSPRVRRDLIDIAFGDRTKIAAKTAEIVRAINEYNRALAGAEKLGVAGRASPLVGSNSLQTLGLMAGEYKRVTNEAHAAAIAERELAMMLDVLERKGYTAFVGMLRGLGDVGAATARARRELALIGNGPVKTMDASAGMIAYQREIAANKQLALQVEGVQTQMRELDRLNQRVRESGGRAMLPFINGARTLEDSISRANRALLSLTPARGGSAPWSQAISAGKRLADQAAMERIGQSAFTPQIRVGQGTAIAADFARVNKEIQSQNVSLGRAIQLINEFQARTNALALPGHLPGTQMAQQMRDLVDQTKHAEGAMARLVPWLKQVYNTVVRWAIGYFLVSQLIGGVNALKFALLDYNAILERSQIAFTTLMDGSEARARRFIQVLRGFARVTPFEFKDLLPLTQRLSTLGLIATRDIEKKAVPAITAIGNAVSAMGGDNQMIDRVVLALGQMVQKGKASSEEVTRQLAEAGINGAQYIATAMGKSVADVFDLMKQGMIDGKAAAQAVLYGIANDPKYKDMMAKYAQSFTGALSNIKDWVNDTLGGAFEGVFSNLSRRMVAFVELTNTTSFQLGIEDRIESIHRSFEGLSSAAARFHSFLVRFNILLPAILLLIATFAKGNPFVLLAVTIARVVMMVGNLEGGFDKMSTAGRVATVVLTAFGLVMAAIQVQGFINSLNTATVSTGVLSTAIGKLQFQMAVLSLSGRTGIGLIQPALALLASSISTIALVSLPLMIGAAMLAGAAWENYKARQDQAKIANHNLAISIDGVKDSIKGMQAALSSSESGTKVGEEMVERFEKAKGSIGSLQAFIGRYGGKAFENDLRFNFKLDASGLRAALLARDQMIRKANQTISDLQVKIEVKNDPYGWDELRKNFADAEKNHDNFVWAFISEWNRAARGLDEAAAEMDRIIARWLDGIQNTVWGWAQDSFGPWVDTLLGHVNRVKEAMGGNPIVTPNDVRDQVAPKSGAGQLVLPPSSAGFGALPAFPSLPGYGPALGPKVPTFLQQLGAAAVPPIDPVRKKMGEFYTTVQDIERMNLKQLTALRARWNKEAVKDGGFWEKRGLDQVNSALQRRMQFLESQVQAPTPASLMRTADGEKEGKLSDAEKARRKAVAAALKLEKDRLDDAAKLADAQAANTKALYDQMARAAEDSSRRQIEALRNINDSIKDLTGSMSDMLAKWGVFDSPLDGLFSKLENILNINERATGQAIKGINQINALNKYSSDKQKEYALHAVHARQSADKLGGGDGTEPAREFKLNQRFAGRGVEKDLGTQAIIALGNGIPHVSIAACANFAGKLLNRLGVAIPQTNVARDLAQNAARLAPRIPLSRAGAGDLIVYRGAREGKLKYIEEGQKVGYHVMVGIGNGMAMGRNRSYVGRIPGARPGSTGYAYDTSNAGGAGYSQALASAGLAVPGKRVTGPDVSGEALAKMVLELRQNLSLDKFAGLPPEFGASIRESEGRAFRFQTQVKFANAEFQKLAKSKLGDLGFKEASALAVQLADAADRTVADLKAGDAIRDLARKDRMRGRENDPFAQLGARRAEGGDLFMASRAKFDQLVEATQREAIKAQTFAVNENSIATRNRIKVLDAARPFIKAATVDEYGLARATELRGKQVEYWNGQGVKDLIRRANVLRRQADDTRKYAKENAQFDAGPAGAMLGLGPDIAASIRQADKLEKQSREIWASLQTGEDKTLGAAETEFDVKKADERLKMVALARQESDRRAVSLRAQLPLVRSTALSETALSTALENQAFYFTELYRLREANFSDSRSREIAAELTARNHNNNTLARQVELEKELGTVRREAAQVQAHLNSTREIYGSTAVGSVAEKRALLMRDEMDNLRLEIESGKFDMRLMPESVGAGVGLGNGVGFGVAFRDQESIEQKASAARARVEAGIEEETLAARRNALNEVELRLNDTNLSLIQKGLELTGSLTEAEKFRMDYLADQEKRKGMITAMTAEELAVYEKIYDVLKRMPELEHNKRIQDLRDRIDAANIPDDKYGDRRSEFLKQRELSRITDPLERARQSEAWDFEKMARDAERAAEAVRGAWDSMGGAVQNGLDLMVTGSGGVFSRIIQGANQVGVEVSDYFLKLSQQILANQLMKMLVGAIPGGNSIISLITGAAGSGIFGGTGNGISGFAGPLGAGVGLGPGVGFGIGSASGISRVPEDGYYKLHDGEKVLSREQDRVYAQAMAKGGGNVQNVDSGNKIGTVNITNNFPNVRTERDAQAVGDTVNRSIGGGGDSRRSTSQNVADMNRSGSKRR